MKKEFEEETLNIEEDSTELFERYRFVVDKGQSLIRIDKWLLNHIEGVSRNKIQHAIEADMVTVNDRTVKSSHKIKPCDTIVISLPDPACEIEIIPQEIPIDIVYEDDDLIIVNKKPNMVAHPAYGNYSGTLLNALTFHFQNQPETVPMMVHRIDKDTSGLLVVAKNETSQMKLAKQFYDHTTERKYEALAWGDFTTDQGTISGNVGRSLKDRKIMDVFPEGDQGKHATTHYKVIKRYGFVTLLECVLETGRTHQIRAHLRHIGHPLFNDAMYGGNQILKGTTFSKYKQFVQNCFSICPRQMLHARTLGFIHPTTKQKLSFSSPLPSDMQHVLDKWEQYIQNQNIENI